MGVRLKQTTTPSAPADDYVEMYAQDGDLYQIDSAGRIANLSLGSGADSGGSSSPAFKRVVYPFGSGGFSASKYLQWNGAACDATFGAVVPRAGSITALAGATKGLVVTTPDTVTFEATINGNFAFQTDSVLVDSAGAMSTHVVKNLYEFPFQAGDHLQIFCKFGATLNASLYATAMMELTYD